MLKFALRKIDEINGIVDFHKLIINGECQYDKFCSTISSEGHYNSELIKIQSIIQQVSENKRLPSNKYHSIDNDECRGWEIKTKNLRVYLIQQKKIGKIIIIGGKKNTQKEDINQFINIKKHYLNSL